MFIFSRIQVWSSPASQLPFSRAIAAGTEAGRMHRLPLSLCPGIQSQQGLLATYLIPVCVGRGVRLGSGSSSGGAVAGGAKWKLWNLEILNLEKLKENEHCQNESLFCPKRLQGLG